MSNLSRFMPDLDPSTVETLAATVPRLQAPAVRNLLYKYLTGKAAMGANICVITIFQKPVSKQASNFSFLERQFANFYIGVPYSALYSEEERACDQ